MKATSTTPPADPAQLADRASRPGAATSTPKVQPYKQLQTMETTHTPAPTISPVTAALLAALRTYEQAVDNYFCAVSELRATSPDTWPELKPEEQSAFEAGRAVIYGKIQERLNLWANTTDPAAQL